MLKGLKALKGRKKKDRGIAPGQHINNISGATDNFVLEWHHVMHRKLEKLYNGNHNPETRD
jgi:hypothetical protein